MIYFAWLSDNSFEDFGSPKALGQDDQEKSKVKGLGKE